MATRVLPAEFDWDSGNWPKCGKHDVSLKEIEHIFANDPMVGKDPYPKEDRFRAVGKTPAGRYVFIVFTERRIAGIAKIRPISARYMGTKEIKNYEQGIKKIPRSAQ